LFCDDKKKIPAHLQKISPVSGKPMTTVGKVWSDFEIYHFKQQSQPLYAIMDGNGKLLSETYGYNSDAELFQEWLECGLKRFK
jgi:thiol:disulfide interchange protein DsbD